MVTPLLPDNWEHLLRTHRIRGENRSIFIFCAIVPQVSWSSPATSLLLLLRPWRRSKPRGFPFCLPSSVRRGQIVGRERHDRPTNGRSQVGTSVRRTNLVPSRAHALPRAAAPGARRAGEKSGGHTVVVSCPPIVEEGGRASKSSLSSWPLLRLYTLRARLILCNILCLPQSQWWQRERLPSKQRKVTQLWRRQILRRRFGETRESETG